MIVQPTIAVVVVARNEAALISRCIGSIASQTRSADKVILVDDGSTDNTIALARDALPSIEVLLRHTRSLARNRNDGWRAASTDYVAYLDADCEAPPHWLENLLAEAMISGADAVGGGNRPPLDEGPHFAALGLMLSSYLGSRGSVQGAVPRTRRVVEHLPTLNVLYRTAALEQAGGFDPEFTQIGEDEDLSRRMGAIGCCLVAIPDATVIHRQRPDMASWTRNMVKYGKGRTWLLRRHPNAWSPLFLIPPLMWLALPLYLPLIAFAALWCALAAQKALLAPRLFALFIATHLAYGAGQIIAFFQPLVPGRPRPPRVAVLALKNAGNKGDEAIVSCLCGRLKRNHSGIDFYLGALGPSGFDIRPLPVRGDMLDAMILDQLGPSAASREVCLPRLLLDATRCLIAFIRFDNVFIGGGQWLHDLSFGRHLAVCALFGMGRLAGTKVGVFCIGVGPLDRSVSRHLLRLAFGRGAMMIVRDDQSRALLEACGMTNVMVATDPVVEMQSRPIARDEQRVLISPCEWTSFVNLYRRDASTLDHSMQSLARLVEGLRARDRKVAFLPTMNPEDANIARSVSRICGPVELIDTDCRTPREVQEEIAGAGLLISMRLHPAIFASNVGTPVVAMNYAAKVQAFCSQAGIEQQLFELDGPWFAAVLSAVDACDPETYRAALRVSRPKLMQSLQSAYLVLSAWFPKYQPTIDGLRKTDRNADAYRLR
jgi:polysaccharide pyruvyl transferase WcaK-like protein/glycosyltransferase involved in cell wall biosynthesis